MQKQKPPLKSVPELATALKQVLEPDMAFAERARHAVSDAELQHLADQAARLEKRSTREMVYVMLALHLAFAGLLWFVSSLPTSGPLSAPKGLLFFAAAFYGYLVLLFCAWGISSALMRFRYEALEEVQRSLERLQRGSELTMISMMALNWLPCQEYHRAVIAQNRPLRRLDLEIMNLLKKEVVASRVARKVELRKPVAQAA